MTASQPLKAIIGLGKTGLSCARFLQRQGTPFMVADTRAAPPELETFQKEFPEHLLVLGPLQVEEFSEVDEIIVSPGVSLNEPALISAKEQGISVVGDIEIFARHVTSPIVAITGCNGKSTVTTLVAEMARGAGQRIAAGGNLGIPALDVVDGSASWYILELSSFQLEGVIQLNAKLATILNLGEDHLDRYASVEDYWQAKQRIYSHADIAVVNRQDPNTYPKNDTPSKMISFGLDLAKDDNFGLLEQEGTIFLAQGDKPLISCRELRIVGEHNWANALSALALAYGMGLDMKACSEVLKNFEGLPHRCQWVRTLGGVDWYNDSKGTNVSATCAAIKGLKSKIDGPLILIAGGQSKNADFSSLVSTIQTFVYKAVLIGEAAGELHQSLGEARSVIARDMSEAVNIAHSHTTSNGAVLLSPACASFDMFDNYEARGDAFIHSVQGLTA